MSWVTVLTWALWLGAWVALWYRGKLMYQRGYWEGRGEELAAQVEGQQGGPLAYLLKVRAQIESHWGAQAASSYVEGLKIEWEEPE